MKDSKAGLRLDDYHEVLVGRYEGDISEDAFQVEAESFDSVAERVGLTH